MTTPRPVYQQIAMCLEAAENCRKAGNAEWLERHMDRARELVSDNMPSGSGIDNGTALLERSTPQRLVFQAPFHHMDDSGYYDGWSDHEIIVTPSLAHGFVIRVTGQDRNWIKDHLAEVFHQALSAPIAP